MIPPRRIVIVHTAFIGDIVLALPLAQFLRDRFAQAWIAFVAIPAAAAVLENHPAVDEVLVFDKKEKDRGLKGVLNLVRLLKSRGFDTAVVPHRSLRSAMLVFLSGISRRIGFSKSAGKLLFTDVVHYDSHMHEIERNLNLAAPLVDHPPEFVLPRLYPDTQDVRSVDEVLTEVDTTNMIAVAPGSVWNTKRWPVEKYKELCGLLSRQGFHTVLVGGPADAELCKDIGRSINQDRVLSVAGKLSLLQSAEIIGRCRAIISNDSAPMHLGVSMRTPVVAIYGSTIPGFGFAPRGEHDAVVEINGLECRPCSIHGRTACPIGTFVCMTSIQPDVVLAKLLSVLASGKPNQ